MASSHCLTPPPPPRPTHRGHLRPGTSQMQPDITEGVSAPVGSVAGRRGQPSVVGLSLDV